jgi:hypothetical protein
LLFKKMFQGFNVDVGFSVHNSTSFTVLDVRP